MRTLLLTLEGPLFGGGGGGHFTPSSPTLESAATGLSPSRQQKQPLPPSGKAAAGHHIHAGAPGAPPLLLPPQRTTAILELLPLLSVSPLRTLKLREALGVGGGGGGGGGLVGGGGGGRRGGGGSYFTGTLPSETETSLFRSTLQILSTRTHDTGEELDLPDSLDEVLVSLMSGGRVGGVLKEAQEAKRKIRVGPVAVPGAVAVLDPPPLLILLPPILSPHLPPILSPHLSLNKNRQV